MPKLIIYILTILCVFKIQAQEKFKVSAEDLISLLNEEVQKEINLVRQNPERYQKILFELGRLDSSRYFVQSEKIWFIDEQGKNFSSHTSTHEGIVAYQEADSFLANQKKLEPYMFNKRLRIEAKKHCEYLNRTGKFTHDRAGGKDASYIKDLIDSSAKITGEVLALRHIGIFPGEFEKKYLTKRIKVLAQEILLGWIVDDGIWNRGHRDAIFDTIYNRFGAYCHINEKDGGIICAVEFSNSPFKD